VTRQCRVGRQHGRLPLLVVDFKLHDLNFHVGDLFLSRGQVSLHVLSVASEFFDLFSLVASTLSLSVPTPQKDAGQNSRT
jgi:hypothetical protein